MSIQPPSKINKLTRRQEWTIVSVLFAQFFICASISSTPILVVSTGILFVGPHILYLGTNFFPKLLLFFELHPFQKNSTVAKMATGIMLIMLLIGLTSAF